MSQPASNLSIIREKLGLIENEARSIEASRDAYVATGYTAAVWFAEDQDGNASRYLLLCGSAKAIVQTLSDMMPTYVPQEGEPSVAMIMATITRAKNNLYFKNPRDAGREYLEAGEHAGLSQFLAGLITGLMIH